MPLPHLIAFQGWIAGVGLPLPYSNAWRFSGVINLNGTHTTGDSSTSPRTRRSAVSTAPLAWPAASWNTLTAILPSAINFKPSGVPSMPPTQ